MNRIISKYLFFFPIRYIRGENIIKYLNHIKVIEGYDSKDLKSYQIKKLKEMIGYAYHNIPYYEELFDKIKLKPEDIKKPDDLHKIPPLTKNKIKKKLHLLNVGKRIRTSYRVTSGSTGQPLKFVKDRFATAHMDAVEYHVYGWHGIKLGAPQARFWSLPNGLVSKIESKLIDFFMNRRRLNALKITNDNMLNFYKNLIKFRPDYFYGYPSLIYEFAHFIEKNRLNTDFLNLLAVIGTGEMTSPKQILLIEKVFNANYVNEYGCTESGLIGFSCKQGSLHLMAHNIYIESVNNGKHVFDEIGDFLITELNAKTFPFIRYQLGDRGILTRKKCDCNLNLPLIRSIIGRTVDNILTPSGHKINDSIFEYLMKGRIEDSLESFKAIQTNIDNIDLYMVVNEKYSNKSMTKYVNELKKQTFGEININVKLVSQLPREKSGKNRVFVSRI